MNQGETGLRGRLPAGLSAYAALLGLTALALGAGLVIYGYSLGNIWVLACLAAVAAIAERGSVRLTSTTEVSISLLPALFAAVMLGPLASMVVSAMSMVADVRSTVDRPYLRWFTYTSTRSITGALTGLIAEAVLHVIDGKLAGIAAATIAGALVAEALDVCFAALTHRVRGNGRPLYVVRTLGPLAAAAVPLYAPIVALLVVAYQEVSAWTLPFFLVPALAAQRLYGLYEDQRRLASDLVGANQRLEHANLSFATALVTTLDARDRYTAGHSAAVAVYARDIAQKLGLSDAEQRLGHLSGLVHDIGKIGLPAGLLEKPGHLTLEERYQMEVHSEIGERILKKVDGYEQIAAIVRHHHERVDGHGYPDRIGGEAIPLLSRVIAVADAYNAMTSDRPYRSAMHTTVARSRLAQAAGSQFDSAVVAAFDSILADAGSSYLVGQRADFSLEAQDYLREEALQALAV